MTNRQPTAKQRLIVALDVSSADAALGLVNNLQGKVGAFKVGLELFTATGPSFVERLVAQGERVFLDLKLHDIPSTVRSAARAAARLGVFMFDLHASGGRKMMQAALDGVAEGGASGKRPLLLGVTILTSLAVVDLEEIGVAGGAEAAVVRLARLAQQSGLDGVVASPQEAKAIRAACGAEFVIVTPGIRPAAASAQDQARAATPAAAIEAGADFLVVGRPITQAADPVAAAAAIVAEIDKACVSREAALRGVRGGESS